MRVLFIKRIILFKSWVTLAFFKQSGIAPFSKDLLMQSANTENVKFHSFKIFVGISPPTDLLLLGSLITCFTSVTETHWNENLLVILEFCLIFLMLGWSTNLIKMLYIPSFLLYDGWTLEEPLVHMSRSSDSTMDPKYSLNVLAISLFLRILSVRMCFTVFIWKVRLAF